MTIRIHPLETWYAGCRFRSRLEARWAVFFDHLGIGWEYEPQGFSIDGKPYLPDFRTDFGWAEVKGSDADLDKQLLSRFGEANGLLILGPIPRTDPEPEGEFCWLQLGRNGHGEEVGFGYWQSKRRLWLHYPNTGRSTWTAPVIDADEGASALAAYAAARSARFEHGERGA